MNALLTLALAVEIGFTAQIDKEAIRRLLAAGVSQDTIVEFVRKNAPATPLTSEDVTRLKEWGASDAVITAMLDASRAPAEPQRTVVVPSYTYSYPYYPNYYYYYRPYPYSSYSYRYPSRYDHYPRYLHRPYAVRPHPYRTTVPHSPPPRGGVDRYRR